MVEFYFPESHRSVKKAGIEVQELEGEFCKVKVDKKISLFYLFIYF